MQVFRPYNPIFAAKTEVAGYSGFPQFPAIHRFAHFPALRLAFQGLFDPLKPSLAVPRKFQQKLSSVAAMSQMPDLPGNEMPIRPCHGSNSFNSVFNAKKRAIRRILGGFKRLLTEISGHWHRRIPRLGNYQSQSL
jgi:hypothetical protein